MAGNIAHQTVKQDTIGVGLPKILLQIEFRHNTTTQVHNTCDLLRCQRRHRGPVRLDDVLDLHDRNTKQLTANRHCDVLLFALHHSVMSVVINRHHFTYRALIPPKSNS